MPRRKTLPAPASPAMQTLTFGPLLRHVPRATVQALLTAHGRDNAYACKLPALLMVYYLIALSLQRALPTREVWRWLLDGLRTVWGAARLPATVAGKAALAMARTRLGPDVLAAVFAACARPLATAATQGAWALGYRLVALDGTVLAVPDTPANAAAFGYAGSKHGPSAFPLVRVVGLVELGTHAVIGTALGANRASEVALADALLPTLQPDMLCLADRLYFSRVRWAAAAATGAALLWRLADDVRLPVEQELPDGTYLTTVTPGCRARVITYTLPGVPGSAPAYRLLTTLCDPAAAPAATLAALYHARWEAESVLDELKTHLRGGDQALLRSLTPAGVRQEGYGLLLAHYVVRAVMHDAALQADRDPDTLSFVHTVRVIRRVLPQAAALPPSAVVTLVPEATGGSAGRARGEQPWHPPPPRYPPQIVPTPETPPGRLPPPAARSDTGGVPPKPS